MDEPMRFVSGTPGTPKPLRVAEPRLGTSFGRALPRLRSSTESYTVGDQLMQKLGGRREYGSMLDRANAVARTKPRRRRRRKT